MTPRSTVLLALALALGLLLAPTAPALAIQCPEVDQLVQQGGQWTAPGGWTQSKFGTPTSGARISDFGGARYVSDGGTAFLHCFYAVVNQPGVTMTQISHTAPLVKYELPENCGRVPGFSCPSPFDDGSYPLLCLPCGGPAQCQVLP